MLRSMVAPYPVADVAALIGEPTRAAMLLSLLDGQARTASELARVASLSASATSLHLAKLTQAGLVLVESAGRHRYYRLAGVDVAHALEALGVIATRSAARALSPKQRELREARTCYDHLAGVMAVELTRRFEAGGLLQRTRGGYEVTPRGASWFSDTLQIDVAALASRPRPVTRLCVDWTERRPHLAGALGASMLDCFIARRWLKRRAGTRALSLTESGRAALKRLGA